MIASISSRDERAMPRNLRNSFLPGRLAPSAKLVHPEPVVQNISCPNEQRRGFKVPGAASSEAWRPAGAASMSCRGRGEREGRFPVQSRRPPPPHCPRCWSSGGGCRRPCTAPGWPARRLGRRLCRLVPSSPTRRNPFASHGPAGLPALIRLKSFTRRRLRERRRNGAVPTTGAGRGPRSSIGPVRAAPAPQRLRPGRPAPPRRETAPPRSSPSWRSTRSCLPSRSP
jgi:hypothetical protein